MPTTQFTPQQQHFIDGVARGMNGTRAYCEAYPDAQYASARVSASLLLKREDVRAEVDRRRKFLRRGQALALLLETLPPDVREPVRAAVAKVLAEHNPPARPLEIPGDAKARTQGFEGPTPTPESGEKP